MSKRNDAIYRYGKQGRRPREIGQVNQHIQRKRTKAQLRTLRYLRMPLLSLPDFAIGAVSGFAVLAFVLTIAGLVS